MDVKVPRLIRFHRFVILGPTEFVQKKHRVEWKNPSVLQAPYFSAKSDCGFQTPFPTMGFTRVLSLQCSFPAQLSAWKANSSKQFYIFSQKSGNCKRNLAFEPYIKFHWFDWLN